MSVCEQALASAQCSMSVMPSETHNIGDVATNCLLALPAKSPGWDSHNDLSIGCDPICNQHLRMHCPLLSRVVPVRSLRYRPTQYWDVLCWLRRRTTGTVQRENGWELRCESRYVPGRMAMSGKRMRFMSDPRASPLPWRLGKLYCIQAAVIEDLL